MGQTCLMPVTVIYLFAKQDSLNFINTFYVFSMWFSFVIFSEIVLYFLEYVINHFMELIPEMINIIILQVVLL